MPITPGSNMSMRGLLAIDTSTEHAGIAISTDQAVDAYVWPAARAQTTTVLPEIDRLVRVNGLNPTDIMGLIVATGPGTFTGLRVGMAIAKGMIAARSMPIAGIPTLNIVFAMHEDEDIIAVLPAGRGRIVWQQRGESPRNSTIDEFVAIVSQLPETILVGELTPDQGIAMTSVGIRFQQELRDPAVLLQLGVIRIAQGEVDDPVTLQPTYLHGVTVNAPPVQDRLRKA